MRAQQIYLSAKREQQEALEVERSRNAHQTLSNSPKREYAMKAREREYSSVERIDARKELQFPSVEKKSITGNTLSPIKNANQIQISASMLVSDLNLSIEKESPVIKR